MMTELWQLTLCEAAALISTKQVSPVELTRAFLARIEALNDTLHAFLLVTPEQALVAAQSAEDKLMAGSYRGPIHGIPIGI